MARIGALTIQCFDERHSECDGTVTLNSDVDIYRVDCDCECHHVSSEQADLSLDDVGEALGEFLKSTGQALGAIFEPLSNVILGAFGPLVTEITELKAKVAKLEGGAGYTYSWTGAPIPSPQIPPPGSLQLPTTPNLATGGIIPPSGQNQLIGDVHNPPEYIVPLTRSDPLHGAASFVDAAVRRGLEKQARELERRISEAAAKDMGIAEVRWPDGGRLFIPNAHIPAYNLYSFPDTAAYRRWEENQGPSS